MEQFAEMKAMLAAMLADMAADHGVKAPDSKHQRTSKRQIPSGDGRFHHGGRGGWAGHAVAGAVNV